MVPFSILVLQLHYNSGRIAWREVSPVRLGQWHPWVSLVLFGTFSDYFLILYLTASHYHSTARLTLWTNSLTGPIPSEIKSLTSLSESNAVWLILQRVLLVLYFKFAKEGLLSMIFILQLHCLSVIIILQANLFVPPLLMFVTSHVFLNWISVKWRKLAAPFREHDEFLKNTICSGLHLSFLLV
jgi:hypothetical protein